MYIGILLTTDVYIEWLRWVRRADRAAARCGRVSFEVSGILVVMVFVGVLTDFARVQNLSRGG